MKTLRFALMLSILGSSPAWADRVQVFSVQGFTCDGCESELAPHLKKVKGIKKFSFDGKKYEYTMTLADGFTDQALIDVFKDQGYKAIVGPGHGQGPDAYVPEPYPEHVDMKVVAPKGEAVGTLDQYRIDGKFTVLDFYADWCGPCRDVDRQLHGIVADRKDIAIRKFNIVDFESPLAKEMGARLTKLPYVVVFDPAGKRKDIVGTAPEKLVAALRPAQ